MILLAQSRDDLLAGSNLTFTIYISVDSSVDTPHTVSVSWTKDGNLLTNGGRITVSAVSRTCTNDSNLYQAQLMFSTLSSIADSGMYIIIVSVNSISSYPYVTSVVTSTLATNQTVSITVTGKNSINAVVILFCTTLSHALHICED